MKHAKTFLEEELEHERRCSSDPEIHNTVFDRLKSIFKTRKSPVRTELRGLRLSDAYSSIITNGLSYSIITDQPQSPELEGTVALKYLRQQKSSPTYRISNGRIDILTEG